MSLTKDQILQADDLPVEEVDVPEWRGSVRVRGLDCARRDDFQALLLANSEQSGGKVRIKSLAGLKPRLVQMCTFNGDGNLIFEPGDIEALSRKSAGAIDRIWDVAMRLSGMAGEVEEALKSAEGNSGNAASAGSGSS